MLSQDSSLLCYKLCVWAEPKDSSVYMFYMEVFQAWSQPIRHHMDVYTGQL